MTGFTLPFRFQMRKLIAELSPEGKREVARRLLRAGYAPAYVAWTTTLPPAAIRAIAATVVDEVAAPPP
jgi:hypothetical protein